MNDDDNMRMAARLGGEGEMTGRDKSMGDGEAALPGEAAPSTRRNGGASRSAGPTMTDVAMAAGVSQTTVSLVLNDAQSARLSRETREHVLDAARKLGYRLVKRGVPSQSTAGATAIGFVVNEMST